MWVRSGLRGVSALRVAPTHQCPALTIALQLGGPTVAQCCKCAQQPTWRQKVWVRSGLRGASALRVAPTHQCPALQAGPAGSTSFPLARPHPVSGSACPHRCSGFSRCVSCCSKGGRRQDSKQRACMERVQIVTCAPRRVTASRILGNMLSMASSIVIQPQVS